MRLKQTIRSSVQRVLVAADQPNCRAAPWWMFALLTVAIVAAYANSLPGVFLFDDQYVIEGGRLSDFDGWSLLRPQSMRSLVMLTFAVNQSAGGLDVRGYHLVNIGIHLLAGWLLFDLLRRSFALPRVVVHLPCKGLWLALAIALLWLVHPLQTQAVTYIVQRLESLMALFYLAFLYCIIRGATGTRGGVWYVAALVMLALGLRSKEVMITAPVVGLLMDRALFAADWKTVWQERKWLYLACFVPAAVAVLAALPSLMADDSTVGFGVARYTEQEYLQTQPGVVVHYLRLIIWPYPQCFDYDWQVARSPGAILVPGVMLASLLIASAYLWRRLPALSFLIWAFFIILAPTSSFMPLRDMAFEHRMYLPSAVALTFLVPLVAAGIRYACKQQATKVSMAAIVVVTLFLGALTVRRNMAYYDALEMWSDVLETAPHNSRAYHNLAVALQKLKRYPEAVAHAERALELSPQSAEMHAMLATALADAEQDLPRARHHAEEALRLKPEWPDALGHLGYVAAKQKEWMVAIHAYRGLLEARPQSASAHANLARLLAATGKRREALDHQQQAQQLDPAIAPLEEGLEEASDPARLLADEAVALAGQQRFEPATAKALQAKEMAPRDAVVLCRVGFVYAKRGESDLAEDHFRQAIAIDPRHSEAWYLLGNVQRLRGDSAAAIVSYQKALELNPDFAEPHNNLGTLLAVSDPAQAERHFEAAIRIDPNNCDAYSNLGNAHLRQGRRADAIRCYQKALELCPLHPTARRNLQVVLGSG